MPNLYRLDLDDTQIIDGGLAHLKELANLTSLSLDRMLVTDAGLEHLKGLTNLAGVYLLGTDGTRKLFRTWNVYCQIAAPFSGMGCSTRGRRGPPTRRPPGMPTQRPTLWHAADAQLRGLKNSPATHHLLPPTSLTPHRINESARVGGSETRSTCYHPSPAASRRVRSVPPEACFESPRSGGQEDSRDRYLGQPSEQKGKRRNHST